MAHLNYEAAKRVAYRGFVILGVVTIVEVFIALLGKGYIVDGFHLSRPVMYLSMICLSLYKAYYIIFEFMHMRYELPGLVRSVLFPTILLIWVIIAFFYEGDTWFHWREAAREIPAEMQLGKPSGNSGLVPVHPTDSTESVHGVPADSAKPEGHGGPSHSH
ncbi:MAG: cytochrome C oxidase subunit IV family protein [Saprospiraceae bacterium]|nr:cytochrome C oxidase subunit IV family protein [Saprospiraceae bacterium]